MVEFRKSRLKSAFALVALACLATPFARADTTLPSGPFTVLEHTQLVGGSFSSALDFLVPAAGKVTVVLSDLVWPDTLSSLHFAATSATSLFGSLDAPGTFSFDVNKPGHYFAIISGETKGALDLGLYTLKMEWSALSGSSDPAVPLPAAGWLLVSGVAGLMGLARRRREAGLV